MVNREEKEKQSKKQSRKLDLMLRAAGKVKRHMTKAQEKYLRKLAKLKQ